MQNKIKKKRDEIYSSIDRSINIWSLSSEIFRTHSIDVNHLMKNKDQHRRSREQNEMRKRSSHRVSSRLVSFFFHLSKELLIFFRLFVDVSSITWHNSIRSIRLIISSSVNTFTSILFFSFSRQSNRSTNKFSFLHLTSFFDEFVQLIDDNSNRFVLD